MEEKWEEIEGTNGNYKISNYGNVLSVRKNILLKHCYGSTSYPVVGISINGTKKQVYIHRLVAFYFIPNPKNKPFVNHINGNRLDYSLGNLEWCTHSENVTHEYIMKRRAGKTNMKGLFGKENPNHKKVKMIGDGFEKIIFGISEAARIVGGSASHITKVCLGKLKTHKGYRWEYA